MLPPHDRLTIRRVHAASQMKAVFGALNTGIARIEVREPADLDRRANEAEWRRETGSRNQMV